MNDIGKNNCIAALALPLAAIIILVSCAGLFWPGIYANETANWLTQSKGQDAIDVLLVCPLLVIAAVFAVKGNKVFFVIWGGVNLYLIYTFVIYCFDVHFNSLFIFYCMALGLSFYSFLYFIFRQIQQPVEMEIYGRPIVKVLAVYFIAIACIFYVLWLAVTLPAVISNSTPASLADTGLATNPVHVIDLAVFLPGLFITGVFLLRKKLLALLFAPALLVFCILMDITIGSLAVAMKINGQAAGYVLPALMAVLAVFSAVLLVWYTRSYAKFRYGFMMRVE